MRLSPPREHPEKHPGLPGWLYWGIILACIIFILAGLLAGWA